METFGHDVARVRRLRASKEKLTSSVKLAGSHNEDCEE